MKNKIALPLVGLLALGTLCAPAYATWVAETPQEAVNTVQVGVPSWDFFADSDFAKIDNLRNATNLTITKETTITQGSAEAIRMTSTTGTSTKDHIININFDRSYTLSEIQFFKFEFDYYHRYKREQYDRGFPKVQFTIDNSTLGSDQGGTDTCTEKSAFIATPIDEDWWHLEFFIFAHMPTIARHNDTPIALTKKINGVRINDRTIYDYAGTTAFVIIDNMSFSAQPASRLGVFNRWTGDNAGKFFWFKVAFAGDIHSCVLSSSNPEIAVPEFDASDTTSTTYPFPNGSPFYFRFLKAGTFTATATLEIGPTHQVMSISNNFTVN